MGQKVEYWCDVCGTKCGLFSLKEYKLDAGPIPTADLCIDCERKIVRKVMSSRPFVLRPYCGKCAGSGKLREPKHEGSSHSYDRPDYETTECPECKL